MSNTKIEAVSTLIAGVSAAGIKCTDLKALRERLEQADSNDRALLEVAERGRSYGITLYTNPRSGLSLAVWVFKAARVLTRAGLTDSQSRLLLANVTPLRSR